jgi:SAM-dependent methyltransferase
MIFSFKALDRIGVLAVRSIRIARNALIDIRHGRLLSGRIRTQYADLGAEDTVNTDYMALTYIFENRIKPTDVLVDVGCGKGRVIQWWLSRGYRNRIIGLELDEDIANKTRQRLRRYNNVSIVAGDAIKNLPADGTLFYLYNPFAAHIVAAFKERLMSIRGLCGKITIIYYECKHVEVFRNDPQWTVEVGDVGGPSPVPFSKLAVITMKP